MTIAEHAREKLFSGELLLHAGDEFGFFCGGEQVQGLVHGQRYESGAAASRSFPFGFDLSSEPDNLIRLDRKLIAHFPV
jgi:hypothetical protein